MNEKIRSTIMVTKDIFKNTRVYAAKKGMDISAFTEEALREKIENIQKEEREQQKRQELATTVSVAKRLYQQIKQKPDFNPTISADFIRNITAGIESEYHDYVMKAITEDEQAQLQTQAQTQPQRQRELQPAEVREVVENYAYSYSLPLPELKFPISKEEMVQQVSEFSNKLGEWIYRADWNHSVRHYARARVPLRVVNASYLVQSLPDSKVYRNETELNLDLDILVNNKEIAEKLIGAPVKIRGCRVNYIPELTDSIIKNMIDNDKGERQAYEENERETKELRSEGQGQTLFRLRAPGLKFPISKNDLMKLSSKRAREEDSGDFGIIYYTTQKIQQSNKNYGNKAVLEKDIMNVYNDEFRDKGLSKRITECIILTDEQKTHRQHLEEERLKGKTKEISKAT